MTYLDSEVSEQLSQPIELYEFTASTGTVYRYTNHYEDVLFGADTYVSTTLKRDALASVSQADDVSVAILVPYNLSIVTDFLFNTPNLSLYAKIYRQQGVGGPNILYWQGDVDTITVEDITAKIIIPSLLSNALGKAMPTTYYQSQCNHILYGNRCGLSEALYRVETTISAVNSARSLSVASVGGNPDQYYKSGVILRVSDNERRLIVNHTGTNLDINTAFANLEVGDTVQILAGCDHSAATCRDKFSNVNNYGGHPFIPNKNIFATGLKN